MHPQKSRFNLLLLVYLPCIIQKLSSKGIYNFRMPKIEITLIKEIIQRFDIGKNIKTIKQLDTIFSYIFVLDNSFMLRGRPMSKGIQPHFELEISLLHQIKNFIPYQLPFPLKTYTQNYFVIIDQYLWTMYYMIQGHTICNWFNIGQATEARDKLILRTLYNIHNNTRGRWDTSYQDRNFFLRDLKKKYQQVRRLLSTTVRTRLDTSIKAIQSITKQLAKEDLCFVHGDFHYGNIIFNDRDKIIGLVDFDLCRIGHPFEDLGYTVMMLLRHYKTNIFKFSKSLYSRFIKWYDIKRVTHSSLFVEYLLVYTLYDIALFKESPYLNNKEYYLSYQLSMLKNLCKQFPTRYKNFH